jgi:signal transduction histidine kinase
MAKLEELEARLAHARNDDERAETAVALAAYWGEHDPSQSLDYSVQALALTEQAQPTEIRIRAHVELAHAHYRLGDYRAALKIASGMLDDAHTLAIKSLEARAHNLIGNCFHAVGDYTSAQENYMELLRIAEDIGDQGMMSGALVNLGIIYAESNNHAKSITYLERGVEVARAAQISEHDLALRIHNLGAAYLAAGIYEKAIARNLEALSVFETCGDLIGIVNCQYTLGATYKSLEQYEKAHDAYAAALTAASAAGAEYYAKGYLPKQLGELLIAEGKPEEALSRLKLALPVLETHDDKPELREAHRLLSLAYRQLGCYEDAFTHCEAYHELYEKIFNEESDERLRALQTRHEVERAQLEAQVYRLKSESLEHEMEARKRSEEQRVAFAIEHQRGEALRELFTNTYHDLMTPITTMRTSLELMDRLPLNDPRMTERRGRVISQLDNLTDKLNSILLMAKLDGDSPTLLLFDHHTAASLVERALRLLRLSPEDHRRIHIDLNPSIRLYVDGELMARALTNLIANALQFSVDPAPLTVAANQDSESVTIHVSDQGHGITEEEMTRIFERFYRGDGSRPMNGGSGLGLPIALAVVRRHGGRIDVKSVPGVGTTFSIVLPTQRP